MFGKSDTFVKGFPSGEAERVYEVYRTMQDAMIAKDISTLDRIIMDGARMKHMSGRTQSKEEYFSEMRSGTLNYYQTQLVGVDVHVDGDTAVLTCTAHMKARVYGMSGTFPLHTRSYFKKINGEWFYTDSPKLN